MIAGGGAAGSALAAGDMAGAGKAVLAYKKQRDLNKKTGPPGLKGFAAQQFGGGGQPPEPGLPTYSGFGADGLGPMQSVQKRAARRGPQGPQMGRRNQYIQTLFE